jgi:hypothetical protein
LFSFGKEREKKGEVNTINTGSESWEMLEEDKDIHGYVKIEQGGGDGSDIDFCNQRRIRERKLY